MADSSEPQNVRRRGILAAAALIPLSLAGAGSFAAVRGLQNDGSLSSPAMQSKRRNSEEAIASHLSQAIQALPPVVAASVLKKAKDAGIAFPKDLPGGFKGSKLSMEEGQKKALDELGKAFELNLDSADPKAKGDAVTANLWRWAALVDSSLPSPGDWAKEDDYGWLQRPLRLPSSALTDDSPEHKVDIPVLSDAYKCLDDVAILLLAAGKSTTEEDEQIDVNRSSQHWVARRRALGFAMSKIERPVSPRAHKGKDHADSERMAVEDYKLLMAYSVTQWPAAVPAPLYNVYLESLSLTL